MTGPSLMTARTIRTAAAVRTDPIAQVLDIPGGERKMIDELDPDGVTIDEGDEDQSGTDND